MKNVTKPVLAALALCGAAPANAAAIIDFTSTTPISGLNDFQSDLNLLGLSQVATLGSSIMLNADSVITFEFLGSESGFSDTFATATLSFTEFTSFVDNFASPVLIGSEGFNAGSLAGLLNFTSSGGVPATVGSDGFGIFLGPNAVSGDAYSVFYFGYDDQITNQDDDFDDFIVRATITAVPEVSTWAMMLFGFAAAGYTLRRKPVLQLRQLA